MRKLLLSSLLLFTICFSFCQIPNADMEWWDNQPRLLNWESNSWPMTLPAWEPYIVRQDPDSYSGNYAANFYANGLFKAYAFTTFAVSFHPDYLSLAYKLDFAPCVNDPGYPERDTVSVLIEVLNNGLVVDQGYWESSASNSNYANLLIPISQNSSAYDSCRITIHGGRVFGGCGFVAAPTEFKVDELHLKYSSLNGCIDSSQICDTCACIALYDPVCGCDGNTYSNSCEAYNAGIISWSAGECSPQTGCIDPALICGACPCPLIYSPVCGCDGVTYSNSCEADNKGVMSYTTGACNNNNGCAAYFYYGLDGTVTGVDFYDGSWGNYDSLLWDFGDGTSTTSTPFDPVHHNYAVTGFYDVCLTMFSNDTSCTNTYCETILVQDPSVCVDSSYICDTCVCITVYDPVCGCDGITYYNSCEALYQHGVMNWYPGECFIPDPCDAQFYYWLDGSGYTVQFQGSGKTDPSGGGNGGPNSGNQTYFWDFGDGATSTDEYPLHTYSDTTITAYLVCLTVSDSVEGCTNTHCDSVYVGGFVYGCYAGFGYTIDSNGVVVVYPDSTSGLANGWTWVIGNANTNVDPNPTFQLDSSNNYNVCFIVMNDSLKCTDTVCITTTELYSAFLAMGYRNLSKEIAQLYLYPNPATDKAELRFTTARSGKVEVAVRNMLGETVYAFPAGQLSGGSYVYTLPTGPLSSGLYLVEMKIDGLVAAVKKLIRQ